MIHPFRLRRAVNILRRLDVVDRAYLYQNRIVVLYKTGLRSVYVFAETNKKYNYVQHISSDDFRVEPTQIGSQLVWNPFGDNSHTELYNKFFRIPRASIDKATTLERDILIHRLVFRIEKCGYCRFPYTDDHITQFMTKLDESRNAYSGGIFTLYPVNGHRGGFEIIDTFFNIENITSGNRRPFELGFSNRKIIYSTLKFIVERTKYDITMDSFKIMLHKRKYGPAWYSPVTIKAIIQQAFKDHRSRTFSDPDPYVGIKALGCGMANVRYAPINHGPISKAIGNGFAAKTNINLADYDTSRDIILYDNNFNAPDINTASNYLNQYNGMILYVPRSMATEFKTTIPPSRIFKLKTKVGTRDYDYIFIYR